MKLAKKLNSIFFNKCPRCHQSKVFVYNNPFNLLHIFDMYKKCEHCNLVYEKEVGFFYGAMYASYGLTVGWFIIWYAIQNFFLELDTMGFAIGVALSIILMSPLSLRWSRMIWLNLFNAYDPSFTKSNQKK